MRVGGEEYTIPNDGNVRGFSSDPGNPFSDNFKNFTLTDSTVSLKTIITVVPEIIGTPNTENYDDTGMVTPDPYIFIKIEVRVNE